MLTRKPLRVHCSHPILSAKLERRLCLFFSTPVEKRQVFAKNLSQEKSQNFAYEYPS